MSEKKFEEYSKPTQILAVIFALIYVVFFGLSVWNIIEHLLNREYFKAIGFASFFLTGWFWSTARNRKRKIKRLEIELAGLKASRKSAESTAFVKGWQGGIDFQRKILFAWVQQKTSQG